MNNLIYYLALLAFVIMLPFAFLSYKSVVKDRKYWKYSWTGHALIFNIVFILFFINGLIIHWLGLVSAILLLITGGGLILINLFYFIENKKMKEDKLIKWYLVIPTHFFMFYFAFILLSILKLTFIDLIFSYIILLIYFILMLNKLHIPWIIYSPSKISENTRIRIIHVLIIFLYTIIPIIVYFKYF